MSRVARIPAAAEATSSCLQINQDYETSPSLSPAPMSVQCFSIAEYDEEQRERAEAEERKRAEDELKARAAAESKAKKSIADAMKREKRKQEQNKAKEEEDKQNKFAVELEGG